jgi:hypothetical protein
VVYEGTEGHVGKVTGAGVSEGFGMAFPGHVNDLQHNQNSSQVNRSSGEVESRNFEQLVFAMLEYHRTKTGYGIAPARVAGSPESDF